MDDLLQQFIAYECTEDMGVMLKSAIADSTAPRPHFEFNRFEITVEREAAIVVLEDVLEAGEAGVQRVPLAKFVAALEQRRK